MKRAMKLIVIVGDMHSAMCEAMYTGKGFPSQRAQEFQVELDFRKVGVDCGNDVFEAVVAVHLVESPSAPGAESEEPGT